MQYGHFDDQAREFQNGLQVIRAKAVMDGAPAEALAQQEMAYTSAVHKTAVDTLLAQGDVDGAMAYFDANGDEVAATMAAEVQAEREHDDRDEVDGDESECDGTGESEHRMATVSQGYGAQARWTARGFPHRRGAGRHCARLLEHDE